MSVREELIELTVTTGILPAIKLNQQIDLLPYANALAEGGARVMEITMTTPGVLNAIQSISDKYGTELFVAAGTVLDAESARKAILAGARLIVSPALIPEVIATAQSYQVACYAGAFTATECLAAMRAGADMVKVFPAAVAGPKYMTNLRMVFPEIRLVPSGGIDLENAGEFIRCGAHAISGARNFVDPYQVEQHGLTWITRRVKLYMQNIAEARAAAYRMP